MNSNNTPLVLPILGVNIYSKVIDPVDQVERLEVAFNLDQFYQENKRYTNHEGWLKTQIVKRRKPSSGGHTHYMRLKRTIPVAEAHLNDFDADMEG